MAVVSSIGLAAAALFAACIAAWHLSAGLKAPARLPLRFAAALLASLAAAGALGLGDVAALLLLPLAAISLAQAALARFMTPPPPLVTSLALAAALACGIAAMLLGAVLPALLFVLMGAGVTIAASLNRLAWMAALSGTAMLAAGLAVARTGLSAAVLLCCAAAVIGLARAQPLRSSSLAMRGTGLP